MDINTLFKMGGKADVLLRSNIQQTIGEFSVSAKEPFTLLEGVDVFFSYQPDNSTASTQGTLIAHNKDYPDQIIIRNVPLTQKISNLLFNKRLANNYKTKILSLTSDNSSIIYLPDDICYRVYVYNSDNSFVGYTELVDDHEIESEQILANTRYTIFYEILVDDAAECFQLETPPRSYFIVEIFAKGNLNDQTGDIYFKVGKCALLTNKSSEYNSSSNTVNLNFEIIQSNINNDYFIIE